LGTFNANVNFWWKPEHPRHNAVAARQAFLDAATRAPLDRSDVATRAVLAAIDSALVRGT
jgi:hypothetical protein